MPATPAASADRIRSLLGPLTPWNDVRCVPETGSTNRDVAALAQQGAPEGLVIITEHQTAGRGRFERRWTAPPGASIGMSMLLRPQRPAPDWGWLSLLAGLAVVRGIRAAGAAAGGDQAAAAGRVLLKWPNDVLVQGEPAPGKLCGILSERIETPQGPAAVIGIGINIDLADDELPVPTATSLARAGLPHDKDLVISGVLRHLADLQGIWQRRGHLVEAYGQDCGTIGQPVRVQLDEHTSVVGRAIGVDEQGCLQVTTADGLRTFPAGDVFHLRPGETVDQ